MKKSLFAAIFFMVAIFSTASVQPSFAFGTDPSGRDLRRYVENYLSNAMAHDSLAAKIKASGGAGSSGVYEWLCSLEVSNTLSVGYSVWEARLMADDYYQNNYPKSQFIPMNIMNYCITYSNTCSHWEWNKGCLKSKLGK